MSIPIDLRVCLAPDCALPLGHAGFHVPLAILWQEAGYEKGPWARPQSHDIADLIRFAPQPDGSLTIEPR